MAVVIAPTATGFVDVSMRARFVCILDGVQRRFLAYLTAFAAVAAVAQGVSGVGELALHLTPLFLILALLLCGRYVAEDRIVRRWRALVPQRRRRVRARRRPVTQQACVSLLERSPRLERGPPALATALTSRVNRP